MFTLNQMKKVLKDFFLKHAQINYVYYGEDFDYNALEDITYPSACITPNNQQIQGEDIIYTYKIELADLLDTENQSKSQDEIYNDLLLIANDFISYIDQFDEFDLSPNIGIEKFIDDGGDRVAGVVFFINLSQDRDQNVCAIPTRESFDYEFTFSLK